MFGPVEEPGVVAKFSELELSQGRFQRKPVIIGFTSNEAAAIGGFTGIYNTVNLKRGVMSSAIFFFSHHTAVFREIRQERVRADTSRSHKE